MEEIRFLLHFAMAKECPRSLIKLSELDEEDFENDDIVGLFNTEDPNIKVWISGVGCNNILSPERDVIDYIRTCDCIYSFGLAGSLNESLKVGDLVNVHSVNNLDVNVPDFPVCSTGFPEVDCISCFISPLVSLSEFGTRAICYTSNRFVTKDYVDFLFKDSEESVEDFYKDSYSWGMEESMIALVMGSTDSKPEEDCVVCDMELFYLRKLSELLNPATLVFSYKLVSDIVCKSDNYKEYEGSLETLLSKLYFTVNSVFKELTAEE